MSPSSIESASATTSSTPVGAPVRWSRSAIVGLTVFLVFFLLSLVKIDSFTQDESQYHFPTLLNFYQNGWRAMLNDGYAAANTPLPYLIIAPLAKLAGPSLLLARFVTATVSFSAFLLATALLARRGASPFAVAAFVAFPYFFVNSFVFYAVNFGVMFLLAALLVLQRDRLGLWGNLLAGIFCSAAVSCQQFYLVVPFAVVLHRLLERLRTDAPSHAGFTRRDSVAAALLLFPLIAPLALFAAWGGLTHVNFRVHSVTFSPTNITGILLVVGFYLFPYLIEVQRQITPRLGVAAMSTSAALVVWFRPAYSDEQGPKLFTGLVLHLVEFVRIRQSLVGLALLTLLVASGLLVVWTVGRSTCDAWERLLFLTAMMLTAPLWMNSQVGERHLLGLMVVLLILVLPKFGDVAARRYSGFMASLGASYFFYWVFFKFS